MKLKDISASVGRTISLGNFESLRIDAGGTMTIEEGDDVAAARERLLTYVKDTLKAAYVANHPNEIAKR